MNLWKKRPTSLPIFFVEYVGGADPSLFLTDSGGNTEKLGIDNWKTENIVEFLNTKLLKK